MDSDMFPLFIVVSGLAAIGLICWIVKSRPVVIKENPAHKGCVQFVTHLFSAGSEFIPVIIIAHDREEDKNPYLLVQAYDQDEVMITYDSMMVMNVTDETNNSQRPMSVFGVTYQDFSGEGSVLFIQSGTDFGPTQIHSEYIRRSYDTWAAARGIAPLKLNKEVYRKPSLVRRPA